jgi:hypothetical protein
VVHIAKGVQNGDIRRCIMTRIEPALAGVLEPQVVREEEEHVLERLGIGVGTGEDFEDFFDRPGVRAFETTRVMAGDDDAVPDAGFEVQADLAVADERRVIDELRLGAPCLATGRARSPRRTGGRRAGRALRRGS